MGRGRSLQTLCHDVPCHYITHSLCIDDWSAAKAQYVSKLEQVFAKLDESGDGLITAAHLDAMSPASKMIGSLNLQAPKLPLRTKSF